MGTFHDTNDPLHGITVAVMTAETVYVGRCHERSDSTVVLLEADEHTEGQDGKTNAEYLSRAARFGVWKRHERLELAVNEIADMTPLSNYYRRPGSDSAPEISVAVVPSGAQQDPLVSNFETRDPSTPLAPVSLGAEAVSEVQRLLATEENQDLGLRLGVSGGGCSGLVYKIEFSGRKEGDLIVPQDGFEIYLDRKSIIYLRDVILDFQPGLGGKGFQFNNPNASNTCGCGESFAV